MSNGQEEINRIAERIARRLDETKTNDVVMRDAQTSETAQDVAALRESLVEMQKRLAQLESHIAHDAPRAKTSAQNMTDATAANYRAPQTFSTTYVPAVEASEERFNINEAVTELVDFFEREKICELEPGGKKCDHCAMCSARGF